jgi:hypothetical protein
MDRCSFKKLHNRITSMNRSRLRLAKVNTARARRVTERGRVKRIVDLAFAGALQWIKCKKYNLSRGERGA